MSHHIYQTRAYIVSSADVGEANKNLLLLTEDLGFIHVVAQGVRLLKSKLKSSVQQYSFSRVAVVRGKEVWRLTNAVQLISLHDRRLPIVIKRFFSEMFVLIERLTPTDVQTGEVFALVNITASFCFEQKKDAVGYTKELGLFFSVRLLRVLGYGVVDTHTNTVCTQSHVQVDTLNYIRAHARYFEIAVKNALLESHL